MKHDIIIIGAGLGGLWTGAMLAKEGCHVTILEKNGTIGGGLQNFRRFGESFDTGMHVIGGMNEGGNIRRMCDYLGITPKIRIKHVDDDCTDLLYFAEDKKHYKIAKGKTGFVDSLASYFPKERENLCRYVDAVFNITENLDLFCLRPSEGRMNLFTDHSEEFLLSADNFIANYVTDEKLRSVLAYMNPLYGGRGGQTPAYVHAIISTIYIQGASRFVGGSQHFADILAEVITQNGGRVIPGDAVEWIEVNDKMVDFVRTRKDSEYKADYYISAIHPCSLLKLMDGKCFTKAYRQRLDGLQNAYSAFSIYIKFKKNKFPYVNHSVYYMTEYSKIWNFGNNDSQWPLGFLFMTPPDSNDDKYASKALVTAPMSFDVARQWENTSVGKRGTDYEKWKQERQDELMILIEELYPGFNEMVDKVISASPLTIRDFYGVKEGTISGFSKDCNNITESQVPVVTKVRNLLLTGQNNSLHGFCGVPLTAINTSEAILGTNYIINKINQCGN